MMLINDELHYKYAVSHADTNIENQKGLVFALGLLYSVCCVDVPTSVYGVALISHINADASWVLHEIGCIYSGISQFLRKNLHHVCVASFWLHMDIFPFVYG